MIRKCAMCNSDYTGGIKEFCSSKCYSKNYHLVKYFYKSKNIEKKCANCEKVYVGRNNKYCSRECVREHSKIIQSRAILTDKECLVCKGIFKSAHKSTKYCSYDCRIRSAYTLRRKVKKCKGCGKDFEDKTSSKYCSNECKPPVIKAKDKIELTCVECLNKFFGHSNYRYCSKICRNRFTNRKKHKLDYRRDKTGKVCEHCGFNNPAALHAHHINRSQNCGIMFLCANHHYVFHSLVGRSKKAESSSKEEVLEVLKLYDKTGYNFYGIPKETHQQRSTKTEA